MDDKPVYLVELMHPLTGEILFTDVCARLDVAIEQVFIHFQEKFRTVQVFPRPSYDADSNEIEGVGFFTAEGELVSCITAYHMQRDVDIPSNLQVAAACCSVRAPEFESSLTQLFTSK